MLKPAWPSTIFGRAMVSAQAGFMVAATTKTASPNLFSNSVLLIRLDRQASELASCFAMPRDG